MFLRVPGWMKRAGGGETRMSAGLGGRRGFSKWESVDGKVLVVDSVGEGRERSRGRESGAEMRGGINNARVRGVVNRMEVRKRMDVRRGFAGENERMVAVGLVRVRSKDRDERQTA